MEINGEGEVQVISSENIFLLLCAEMCLFTEKIIF